MIKRLTALLCLLCCCAALTVDAGRPRYDYEVAICAIFRDEARFLKEWIEYHRLMGVDKFILFNHASKDGYEKVLEPYRAAGLVRLYQLEGEPKTLQEWHKMQLKAYNWCLERYRSRVHWLGFLDVDEYVVPLREGSLPLLLADYDEYGGLSITNLLFGTGDVPYIPPERLRIEALTMRAEDMYPMHSLIKSFVQPRHVDHFQNPHSPKFKNGKYAVSALKERTNGPYAYYPHHDIVRIHHYRLGDMTQFYNIKRPRFQLWLPTGDPEDLLRDYDVVEDTTMLQYVDRLRQRLSAPPAAG